MRILHVYKTYYPDTTGGIELVLRQLTRGLAALGVESRLLVLSPQSFPNVLDLPEATVYRYPITAQLASNPMSWAAWRNFGEHLKWADIVHYQFPWPFADLLHLCKAQKTPSVVTYQSDVVRQKRLMTLYRPLQDRFLRTVNRVVATSPVYLESSPVLSKLAHRPAMVPNGLDESCCPKPTPEKLDHWKRLLGEGFFLFVGVLRYYKGLDSLIDAASRVDQLIVIAGAGPEEARLKKRAADAGLKNVRFLGHVSEEDKGALLQLARAFVFPSHLRSEAFGMSLIEASMFAKPMISCEIGSGTSYINLHGTTGLVVQPESPDELADAMLKITQVPIKARLMGEAARLRYEQMFTGKAMAAAYLEIYQRLLTQ
jgi:glycosyltransferase involved in cell wall biosynthesis